MVYRIIWDNEGVTSSAQSAELVISRYNENLDWLKEEPFINYHIHIYNKGNNMQFFSPTHAKITNLRNVGKCDHTYLYHIIHHYNNLYDATIFLPGSLNIEVKMKKAKIIMTKLNEQKNQKTIFVGRRHNDVHTDLYEFKLDNWKTTDRANYSQNPQIKLQLADIRPFGKWYEHYFSDIKTQFISFGGIMCISKIDILKCDIKYYKNLIKQFKQDSNPEVGHYIERAWSVIFKIHPDTCISYDF